MFCYTFSPNLNLCSKIALLFGYAVCLFLTFLFIGFIVIAIIATYDYFEENIENFLDAVFEFIMFALNIALGISWLFWWNKIHSVHDVKVFMWVTFFLSLVIMKGIWGKVFLFLWIGVCYFVMGGSLPDFIKYLGLTPVKYYLLNWGSALSITILISWVVHIGEHIGPSSWGGYTGESRGEWGGSSRTGWTQF